MLYYSQVNGDSLKVEITADPEGATHVKLPDGREMQVDFQPALGEDLFSVLVDNRSHQVHIEPGETRGEYEVTLDGQVYLVNVETERQHRLNSLAPRQNLQSGEMPLKAPMPGLVSIVAVEVGQTVEQGQRIVILEAMKMENELRAPKAGTVKAVNVQAGQTVEQNKVLAVIE
jgi:biotin carboxyl carrier protein